MVKAHTNRGKLRIEEMYNTGMKHRRTQNWLFMAAILLFLALAALPWDAALAQETSPQAIVLTADGPLTPAMAEYLSRGIETAQNENAELLIFQLNTPGGDVTLMSEIVEIIRASRIPVIVYVTPRGAMAASAGTVITLAGHLAAMSPETTIGAASPVGAEGEDIGETMEAKIKETIKAQIRSLAEGRPPEAIAIAEDTVENAVALTSQEAFDVGLVDIIANDISDLLQQLDGRTVETAGGTYTLDTKYVQVNYLEARLIEQLLTVLTNPNIVFLLLSIGVQAILIELGSPGGWVAGFVGVVCLALAAYGLGILPVNWFGLIFLITAFVLFILELKAPVHGALAITGVISFIVGALVLFNSAETPDFLESTSPWSSAWVCSRLPPSSPPSPSPSAPNALPSAQGMSHSWAAPDASGEIYPYTGRGRFIWPEKFGQPSWLKGKNHSRRAIKWKSSKWMGSD
jgi:membrane-bound serine protease (ClpP class)